MLTHKNGDLKNLDHKKCGKQLDAKDQKIYCDN